MDLYITTTVPEGVHSYFRRDAERLQQLIGAAARHGARLVSEPRAAEVVIFVGSVDRALRDIRSSSVFRQDPAKCLVLHGGDEPLPTVPGIYASLPKRWYDRKVHRAGFYLRTAVDGSIQSFAGEEPQHLFSFVGAGANHPVREALLTLRSPDGFLLDSARHPASAPEARELFVRSLQASLFVLCPRGGGTSSFRIFETMMAGRVPVIVSDEWVEPEGPDWSEFSVRIAEGDVADVPRLLAERRAEGRRMGERARAVWEQWFSPQAAGATLLGWIGELRRDCHETRGYRMPADLALQAGLEAARGVPRLFREAVRR